MALSICIVKGRGVVLSGFRDVANPPKKALRVKGFEVLGFDLRNPNVCLYPMSRVLVSF